jgi:murein L,D-transpeptidase YafK
MKKGWRASVWGCAFAIAFQWVAHATPSPAPSASPAAPARSAQHRDHLHSLILVDKKTNLLHLAHYEPDDSFKIIKTYHTTTGKVKGDKEQEGDLKTPEGVYQFNAKILPPQLARKFGDMAFYMNFPNAYDDIAGCTGSAIMLHGTDTPERLKADFDSEGCVVVSNEDLRELEKSIRLSLTPILVFEELTPEYRDGRRSQKLHAFFEDWIRDWESRDVEKYMEHYHTDFSSPIKGKMFDRSQWKAYKTALTTKYSKIQVNSSDPFFFRHPKYTMLMFTQDYISTLQNGRPGLVSRGTKILYIAEENGVPRIISENFTERYY